MISIGDGIAIASVCGVVVTALLRFKPAPPPPPPMNGNRPVTHDLCMARFNSLRGEIHDVKQTTDKIWAALDGRKEK